MPRRPLILAAACAATLALPAAAQTIKPGIWEITNNVGDPSGRTQGAVAELQRQMARMPPDQRTMMEQMMAQNGVQLSPSTGGLVAKVCVTPEMVKNSDLPVSQDGNCSQSHSPVKDGKMSFTFNCPSTQTSGNGEVRFNSDTSYSMRASVQRGGSPTPVTVDSNARWLGADCGALKPAALPR
jgi:hypothetical protein